MGHLVTLLASVRRQLLDEDVVGGVGLHERVAAPGEADERRAEASKIRYEHGRRITVRIGRNENRLDVVATRAKRANHGCDSRKRQRAHVGAMRVAEKQNDSLTALCRKTERQTVLIGEREIGGKAALPQRHPDADRGGEHRQNYNGSDDERRSRSCRKHEATVAHFACSASVFGRRRRFVKDLLVGRRAASLTNTATAT